MFSCFVFFADIFNNKEDKKSHVKLSVTQKQRLARYQWANKSAIASLIGYADNNAAVMILEWFRYLVLLIITELLLNLDCLTCCLFEWSEMWKATGIERSPRWLTEISTMINSDFYHRFCLSWCWLSAAFSSYVILLRIVTQVMRCSWIKRELNIE